MAPFIVLLLALSISVYAAPCQLATEMASTTGELNQLEKLHDIVDKKFPELGNWTSAYLSDVENPKDSSFLKYVEEQFLTPDPKLLASCSAKTKNFTTDLKALVSNYGDGPVRKVLAAFIVVEGANPNVAFPPPGALDRLRVEIQNSATRFRGQGKKNKNDDPGNGKYARSRFFTPDGIQGHTVRPLGKSAVQMLNGKGLPQ
jgi:hypothetical protein